MKAVIPKKKRIKKPVTPRSQVRAALTKLFLRSRERARALQRDKYTCQVCGIKQTKPGKDPEKWVLVEMHHLDGARKSAIIDMIYEYLLCPPERLQTMCRACHREFDHKGIED